MEAEMLIKVITMLLLIGGFIGGLIARDRALRDKFDTKIDSVEKTVNDKTEALHERINRARDDFVRRDDLDKHLTRIERTVESGINSMSTEIKGTNARIDNLMAAIVGQNGKPSK